MKAVRIGAIALAGIIAASGPALATPFSITTTGTVQSGSDPSNLFGVGSNLAGQSYTLTSYFAGIGAAAQIDPSGQSALGQYTDVAGTVTVTIGATTIATELLAGQAQTLLVQRLSALTAGLTGTDSGLDFVSSMQDFGAAGSVVATADLQTPFSYTLTDADSGVDLYSFTPPAATTVSFTGSETGIRLAIAEPASWSMLGLGLLGLVAIRRQRC